MRAFTMSACLLLGLALSAGGTQAQNFTEGMDDTEIAYEAGDIIGGARACGYALDMVKVEAFITTRIAAMGSDDRSSFRSAVDIRDFALREMAENERAAQCILQRELAKKYGFAK